MTPLITRTRLLPAFTALLVALVLPTAAVAAVSNIVTPVSYPYTSGNGLLGGGAVIGKQSISADNRYVVFESSATNLFVGAGGVYTAIFVKDLVDGSLELVSRPDGTSSFAIGDSFTPAISDDGRYVAFQSEAINLDPDTDPDDNYDLDIFVRDLQTQTTQLVSLKDGVSDESSAGTSQLPAIDADGSRIAFVSDADNLVAGVTGTLDRVYLRDLNTDDTILVSRTDDDLVPADSAVSYFPSITPDGNKVAFTDSAQLTLDPPEFDDVFVRDITAGTTKWISKPGPNDDEDPNPVEFDHSIDPYISEDGNVVVFASGAPGLDPDRGSGSADRVAYRHTINTGTTELVSLAPSLLGGEALPGSSYASGISRDGSVIGIYQDYFENEDHYGISYYRTSGETQVAIPPFDGNWAFGSTHSRGIISPDGTAIVFDGAYNEVDPGDSGNYRVIDSVFVRGAGGGMPPKQFNPEPPGPPTGHYSPPPPPAAPAASKAKLSKWKLRPGKGGKLTITTSEAGTLTATFLKGKKKLKGFTAKLKTGKNTVKFKARSRNKKLKTGSYKLQLKFKATATGLAAPTKTLKLKIVK